MKDFTPDGEESGLPPMRKEDPIVNAENSPATILFLVSTDSWIKYSTVQVDTSRYNVNSTSVADQQQESEKSIRTS